MRHLFLLCMLALSCSMMAQNYNLNTYKYRFQKWRFAGINIDLEGGHNQYSAKRTNTFPSFNQQDTTIISEQVSNDHNANFSLPVFYRSFVNTERLQQTKEFVFASSVIQRKTSFTRLALNQQLDFNIDNRFYKGIRFTELNFSTDNTVSSEVIKPSAPLNNISRSQAVSINTGYTLYAGTGRGRLEFVSDAVSALFLLKDLQSKAGIGSYTNEQIESVAKGITKIYNTRFMDFRFRLIDQLTMLDSVLKNNGIISDNPIAYFTTINDNWLFARRFQRSSGSRWSAGIMSNGYRNQWDYTSTFTDTNLQNKERSIDRHAYNALRVSYDFSRQMSLYVQQNFGFGVSGGIDFNTSYYQNNTIAGIKNKPDDLLMKLNAYYGYLFQPDTRTYLQLGVSGDLVAGQSAFGVRRANPNQSERTTNNLYLTTQFEFFRFISQHLSYQATAGFTAQTNRSHYSENSPVTGETRDVFLPFNFKMGLNYMIF